MSNQNTASFDFGANKNVDSPSQGELFSTGGGSIGGNAPSDQLGEGGSIPTPPLQIFQPKDLRIEKIDMSVADAYSIRLHYLHRTAKNSKLALGVFAGGELHGIMIWGLPVAKIKGQYGKNWTQLELRRMYLDEQCGKNCESRCLAISAKIIKKLLPQCKLLIAYSDLSYGHKGGIYKAAGWRFAERIEPDKEGGWSKHPRHNRVELGAKNKWFYPL